MKSRINLFGVVEAICIKDRKTRFPTGGRQVAEVTLEGFVGDVHYGFTRPSDSRDRGITRGTPVRNWRQWSAVSIEEMQLVAQSMGIKTIEPWMLAANLMLSGIPDFTKLERGTELKFEGGAILHVECENAPCVLPGKEIATANSGKTPQQFVKSAMHMRGLVGTIYLPGIIRVGEQVMIRESQL